MTAEQRERLKALKEKLAKRDGRPGWAANVEAIKAAIAEIENGG